MMIVLNILYIAVLFSVFICILFLPFGLLVWGIRRWYATHRLGDLPWRRRRALLGLALLWTAAFSGLARWKKITGVAVILSVLLVAFLSWLNATLYVDSAEAITTYHLRAGRYGWLLDGCPEPPDAERCLGDSPSSTNYVYRAALIVNDCTYHGLFAWRENGSTNTYVITTTGAILVVDGTGKVRLLEKGPRS
jgi:hypothetical protein